LSLLEEEFSALEDEFSTLEVEFSALEGYLPPLEDFFFSSVNLDTFSTTESMMENLPSDDREISLFIKVPEPLPPLLPWLRVSD
jgi:predicted nuclease with TOPRIM domain